MLNLRKFKRTHGRITGLAWLGWICLLLSGRTIVGILRPAPYIDEFTMVWLFAAVSSLLLVTWTIVAFKWNTLITEMEKFEDNPFTNFGNPFEAKRYFEDNFGSLLKYSRNSSLVMFPLGIIGLGYSWSEPERSSCSIDSNGDLSCLNDLSFAGLIVFGALFALALWYNFANRANFFYRHVLPEIEKQLNNFDFE